MLKIRPHHFLCIKAFIGRGYSKDFTENMINTINILKENKNQKIEVVVDLDKLCSKCLNNIKNKICNTNESVIQMDKKVMDYFNIKTGIYEYEEIINLIYNNINEDIIKDICGNCSWYKVTNCKDLILL
ncbi:Protein of uncharacterised function (DUF1284) [uncultured Clostridium sp.]|nr:Protein of uncharacterised function (DUF1284) [uncultured Clostridium sp.]SCJ06356.1 Protein of uncharacterised function (DUF1284) [uncultured Clostridium sp.]